MYKLEDVWNQYEPVFLLNVEKSLKLVLSLQNMINRTCLELNIDKSIVHLSYDNLFLSFEEPSLSTDKIYNFLSILQLFWCSLAKQLNYQKFYHLEIYGIYSYKNDAKTFNKVIALSRRIELVPIDKEICPLIYQKAVQGSYLALPF
jgi:hypothetical protein